MWCNEVIRPAMENSTGGAMKTRWLHICQRRPVVVSYYQTVHVLHGHTQQRVRQKEHGVVSYAGGNEFIHLTGYSKDTADNWFVLSDWIFDGSIKAAALDIYGRTNTVIHNEYDVLGLHWIVWFFDAVSSLRLEEVENESAANVVMNSARKSL